MYFVIFSVSSLVFGCGLVVSCRVLFLSRLVSVSSCFLVALSCIVVLILILFSCFALTSRMRRLLLKAIGYGCFKVEVGRRSCLVSGLVLPSLVWSGLVSWLVLSDRDWSGLFWSILVWSGLVLIAIVVRFSCQVL
jgi:hypothetical protein